MSTSRFKSPWSWYSPFSGPIWGRIWRDYWYITAIACGTLFAFHWLVITFLPLYNMKYRLSYFRNLPDIVKAMIGQDILEIASTTAIGAFAYIHPVTLSILVAFSIMMPSWMLVGQIDRGTIELILSTPTSRRRIISTTILSGVVGGVLLICSMLIGTWVGVQRTKLPEQFYFDRIFVTAINLYALYLLMMSISIFFSSITSIRGMAVGWSMAFSVASYLLHFLSEWWPLINKIAFIGPLYYFRPIKITTGHYDATRDITVLVVSSIVLLIISTVWYSRRDIAVV